MLFGTWELSRFHQTEEAECGLMCLAAVASLLGGAISAPEARQWFGASARGMSVAELCDKAGALGMVSTAVHCGFDELRDLTTPAILHWNLNHYVVLLGCRRRDYTIFDPARGKRRIDAEETKACFSGAAVVLTRDLAAKSAGPADKSAKSGLLSMLWAYTGDAKPQIALLLALSFVLQLVVLALPLLNQVAINFGAMRGNLHAISIVAASMLAMYALSFVVDIWRGHINHQIATSLSRSVSRQLFRHLLYLPVTWFEKRRVADVVNRFESVDPIRTAVSSGLATFVVDGVLGMGVGIALFVISPVLGTVVILSILATAAVKSIYASVIAGQLAQSSAAKVAEYSKRWETVRSITTLKLACAEPWQDRAWAERMDRFLLHAERAQALSTWQQNTAALVNNLGGVLVIFVGARMIAGESLTIGGLFAFVMYRRYLSDKVGAAVDQLSNLWNLRYHHERLDEVFNAEREKRWNDQRENGGGVRAGEIVLQRVAFRHSPSDPILFRDVDATVKAGETMLLMGPTGSGKTTLLRMIAGLAQPSAGAIVVDGIPLSNLSPRQLRGAMAAVLQDDEIFAGSIFENVTMFSETPELARAVRALEQAELWTEVQHLPMALHTPVGESGRLLSAGQRQRILLARAFYRDPAILLLDEATANLDPETEGRILEHIKAMRATKVIVTHQPRLSRLADRLFVLDGRGFREVGRRIDLAEAV